jgi:hypothetical protein
MTKLKRKNPAAVALAALSRKKRFATMTPEQRSEQGRKAVNARRDRQKPDADAPSHIPNRFTWEDGDLEIVPPKSADDKGGQS